MNKVCQQIANLYSNSEHPYYRMSDFQILLLNKCVTCSFYLINFIIIIFTFSIYSNCNLFNNIHCNRWLWIRAFAQIHNITISTPKILSMHMPKLTNGFINGICCCRNVFHLHIYRIYNLLYFFLLSNANKCKIIRWKWNVHHEFQ